jgi:hypothetical protein
VTAAAVIADIVALARGEGSTWDGAPPATAAKPAPAFAAAAGRA